MLLSAFLNWKAKRIAVKLTAITSAIGSARYTPVVFMPSAKKVGTMYMSGRRRTNLRMIATTMDESALPRDTKVIWQAICIPNMPRTAQ